MSIEYDVHVWLDNTEGGTPITAAKLNEIEAGISAASDAIGSADAIADLIIDLPDASTSKKLVYVLEDSNLYLDIGTWEIVGGGGGATDRYAETSTTQILNPATQLDTIVAFLDSVPVSAKVDVTKEASWPLGHSIDIMQGGSGTVTVAANASETIFDANGVTTAALWSVITVTRIATGMYVVTGDTA